MLDKVENTVEEKSSNQLAVTPEMSTVVSDYEEMVVREPLADQPRKGSLFKSLFFMVLQGILMVAILAAAFMATKRMLADKPEARKRPAFKTVYTVETVTANPVDYQPSFVSYGQTVAARSVELRSLVSGEIVAVNPRLRAGARVAKGDVLLEIDRFEYEGALSEARANLVEAKARIIENEAQVSLEQGKLRGAEEQLQLAQDDLARVEDLAKRGTSTQREVDTRRLTVSQRQQAIDLSKDTIKVQQSRVAQIQATVDRLQWRVEKAERDLNSTKLIAPFAGIVRASTAEVGRAITANDVVASLYEADTLEVKFTLTDAQYGRLQESPAGLIDRKVEVKWTVGDKDYLYPAQIDRVGAEIASNRGGVELFALVEQSTNAVSIRPGAFVEVNVPDQLFKNIVTVPDTAIYGGNVAYVKVDGKLEKRDITIAAYENENALVSNGLGKDDQVLVTRITEVSEGLAVRLEGEKPANTGRPANREGTPAAATGRPSREEVAAILKSNSLTLEAWRALPNPEKRKLIVAHRAAPAQTVQQ